MNPPGFDGARFERLRAQRKLRLGAPLSAARTTGSTNDDALEAAARGVPSGAIFVADTQTRGRGRRGRHWISPPGENLTFSLLLRPDKPPTELGCLPLVVGLAVRAAVARRTPATVGVKWPNDVYASGRKIAGVLVESHIQGVRLDAIAVGVGVNVGTVTFPRELADSATSLAALGNEALDRETVLVDVLEEFEARLWTFESGERTTLLTELRAHDLLLGRAIAADGLEGTARGIAEDGALLLETPDRRVHSITSGTVEWDSGTATNA